MYIMESILWGRGQDASVGERVTSAWRARGLAVLASVLVTWLEPGAASAQVTAADADAPASATAATGPRDNAQTSVAPRARRSERGPRGGLVAVKILQVQSGQGAIFDSAGRQQDIQVNPFSPESLRNFFETR